MRTTNRLLTFGTIELVGFGALLFIPAGTLKYWQAWLFLVVFMLASWIPTFYLLRRNPAALERRMSGGPAAETRRVQKIVMAGLYICLASMVVVSVVDHRFGWSSVPPALCLTGDALVAVGLATVGLVVIQNNYAATTVRVESGQTLVSSGLYSLVRHPMYTGNAIMIVGIPLALGSFWGLIFVVPSFMVLAWRIRDEEKLLRAELTGYSEYTRQVRRRLLPGVW